MPNGTHHRVLIVGGGTAGITVAAILRRRVRDLDIAVVEPEQEHYYQPSLTLVGAGVYPLAKTHRPEASVIPPGVIWIRGAKSGLMQRSKQQLIRSLRWRKPAI